MLLAMMNFIPIIRSFHQKDFCLCDGSKFLPWMSEPTVSRKETVYHLTLSIWDIIDTIH